MDKGFIITLILLLVFPTPNLRAQGEFDNSKLDDYLHQIEENNKAMFGLLITKDGRLEYENYIGFSSVADAVKSSNLTKYRIGSITKIYTATIIFQLVEEGKLTLNTKLSEFFLQIPNSEYLTVADLLAHRSGIHNFTNEKDYEQYMTTTKSKEEMVNLIANFEPDFRPNEKTAYSNSNYVLLGYIIEEITKSTYQHELETRISAVLNLTNTYYGSKIDAGNDEAASYRFQQGTWNLQPETDMSIPHGAGAIVSTPYELTVFINALFNHRLMSENSLTQMKEIKEGLGKGLMRFNYGSKNAYGHNGGIDGFVSSLAYFPEEKIALAITANGTNDKFKDILIGILSIYFNAPAINLNSEELKNYEGVFSSNQLPLNITLKVEDGQLCGQATGQSPFPLTPFSKTEFRFDPAGIIITFPKDEEDNIQYNSFVLNQRGVYYTYKKQ
ncbi:serine hydrolase domain-containing protein [Planctomycetota bacterium]